MSSNSGDEPKESVEITAQELRRFTGLSATLLRSAAARIGMTVSDIQVIDILEGSGPATPGELAELTGLTTGAITGMLKRLEDTGILRRERDPSDGRRVIVRLDPASDKMGDIETVFRSLTLGWDKTVAQYDEGEAALIMEFLRRSNAAARVEIVRLREGLPEGEAAASAPLEGVRSGHLNVSGATELKIIVDRKLTDLYQARFEGLSPEVTASNGEVAIRYPRKLSNLFGTKRSVLVRLGTTIPWEITIEGGGAMITADLANLKLSGFSAKSGASIIKLELPVPAAVVPVHLSGGASVITVARPVGVAVRARLKGSATHFVFDETTYDAVGTAVWFQSTDYDATGTYYSFEIASSASSVKISQI